MAHLAGHRGHHPDGRVHLHLLRPRRSLPVHRPVRHRLYRGHQPAHPVPEHPPHRDRRDPGAPPAHRRRGLFFLLPGPGPRGLLRGGVLHHGGLYPHRLYFGGQRHRQRHVVFPTLRARQDDPGAGDHLGRSRLEHQRHSGKRPVHLYDFRGCRLCAAQPDCLRPDQPPFPLPPATPPVR